MLTVGIVFFLAAVVFVFVAGFQWKSDERGLSVVNVILSMVLAVPAGILVFYFGSGRPRSLDLLPKQGFYQVVQQSPMESNPSGKVLTLVRDVRTGEAWLVRSDAILPEGFYLENNKPVQLLLTKEPSSAAVPTPAPLSLSPAPPQSGKTTVAPPTE